MSAVPAVKPASPPPPCCEHDHSHGVRAYVTIHAIRRYGDRILGLEETLEGLDDAEAVGAMAATGIPIGQIRRWLAFYGGVGVYHRAQGVCREGVGLVLQDRAVVTVLSKRGAGSAAGDAGRPKRGLRQCAGCRGAVNAAPKPQNDPQSASQGLRRPLSRFPKVDRGSDRLIRKGFVCFRVH